jgi:hypothetical protein
VSRVPNGLTVFATVRPGEEAPLREVLRAIGDDIKGKTARGPTPRPHIDFTRSRSIHFARFAILDDPARGSLRSRLLFSSNYDGDLDGHLAELVQITSDMQAIWGRCEGYSDVSTFPAFVRAHAHQPEAFYIAFRDETVETIRSAVADRRQLESALVPGPSSPLSDAPRRWMLSTAIGDVARRFTQAIARIIRALPIVVDFVRAIIRLGITNVFRAILRIIATLDRYAVFRLINWITRNHMPPRKSPYSSVVLDNCAALQPVGQEDELPATQGRGTPPSFREDVVTQNQLTLVTVVDPLHVDRVKAVMAAIDSYAKRLAPPGSLIGISTIHFVRWLLIDDDRRLILLSDYDGSWENYIGEFAEMILSGLDAIWETSFGYPPDGARDLPAFKRFLRAHQVPSEVFYSAYPDATTLNISNDLQFVSELPQAPN